jgi:hypothetical protein
MGRSHRAGRDGRVDKRRADKLMAELKTKLNNADVDAFLAVVDNGKRRADAQTVKALMERITGEPPRMWGPSIVGFGCYHYKYDSGREGDWFLTGFSPRKQALTVYIMAGFSRYDSLMGNLGKYTTGKSCLYIKRLEDVDMNVLENLIAGSVEHMRRTYGV